MTVHVSGERIEALLAQLRAEEPLEGEPAQRALLRHELGVLEEIRGDAKAAASEYLAAFDLAKDFREPLEALSRLLARGGDERSLAKILEALATSATEPADRTRALWDLAAHRVDVQGDLAGARECLERGLADHAEDAASWLLLELVGLRTGDPGLRARALEARVRLAADPDVRGALVVELSRALAESGDVSAATRLLEEVGNTEGRARFRARLVLEEVAREGGDGELQAVALEGQAELVAAALDDPAIAERDGVPPPLVSPACAADAWLRAAELRRRNGDVWGAVSAATAAAGRLGSEAVVLRLQLAAADAAGDEALALRIADRGLAEGVAGHVGSALWVRRAQAAERQGHFEAAAEAYAQALALDPRNAVAEAARLPLLLTMPEGAPLARALETAARGAEGTAAWRSWWLAAFAWGARASDAAEAARALDEAVRAGAPPALAATMGRSLAALAGDAAWYEASTARLAALETDPERKALLAFELGRARLLRGDGAAADEAFAEMLSASDDAAWLGRFVAAYAGDTERPRSRAVLRVAEREADVELARGLVLVASWLALREGATERAIDWLSREHERAPSGVTLAVFLSQVLRTGDALAASRVLERTAATLEDPALAGALRIEAGLLAWRAGSRDDAVQAFESALESAPVAARRALLWAWRAAAPDDQTVRRKVAEFEEESDADRALGALERFGLGVLEKGGEADAWAALEQLDELDEGGDVALATALARVLWASESVEPSAFAAALGRLEPLGGAALELVRAERYRRARHVEVDDAAARTAARAWAAEASTAYTALAWLAAAAREGHAADEVEARRAFARHLEGDARVQVLASATTIAALEGHGDALGLFDGDVPAGRLVNLEVALPGSSPGRRAAALSRLGDELGPEARRHAARLAAWSELARGANERAREAFFVLCREELEDIASWEGLLAAAEALGDHVSAGASLLQLGSLHPDDPIGADLLERAGVLLLEHTAAHDEAEEAFTKALARDPKRPLAFERLFRRLRQRGEDDRLLAMIAKRIEVTDDTSELTRMYWERARVYRRQGDERAALAALRNVAEIEPDHVGTLALLGEIRVHAARAVLDSGGDARREFAEAAPILARLAALPSAPEPQRRVSAIAAADVYEKQLDQPEKALAVLLDLHRDGLSTPAMRERVARLAGRVGKWAEAASVLEGLMQEREDAAGRAEAARLAMAIHRDKLRDPARAERAVERLFREIPDDPDAIELVLRGPLERLKPYVLGEGRTALLARLAERPTDARRVRVLADLAGATGQLDAQRTALGVLAALAVPDEPMRQTMLRLDSRVRHEPAIALDDRALATICDPDDEGPLAELFAAIAEVVSTALGPSLRSEGVGKRERIDGGDPLRMAVAHWMGAVGFSDFELYLGGRRRSAVSGVASEIPTLIVGHELRAPFDAAARAAVAREAFALRRGISAVLHHDENAVASVVAAVSNEVGVPVPAPAFAVYKEVDRVVRKAIPRKVRKVAAELCARIQVEGHDVAAWVAAARRSVDRMALLAAGDAATVLGVRGLPNRTIAEGDVRATSLLRFALSREYLELRRRLGMGAP